MSTALLDYNYGVVAVSTWAPEEFKRLCTELAKSYYNTDLESRPQEPAKLQEPEKDSRENRRKRRNRLEEENNAVGGNGGGAGYDYYDMLLGFQMYAMREQRERAEREKKRVNEMMVNEWRATVSRKG